MKFGKIESTNFFIQVISKAIILNIVIKHKNEISSIIHSHKKYLEKNFNVAFENLQKIDPILHNLRKHKRNI